VILGWEKESKRDADWGVERFLGLRPVNLYFCQSVKCDHQWKFRLHRFFIIIFFGVMANFNSFQFIGSVLPWHAL
jgi:hypothetical protein